MAELSSTFTRDDIEVLIDAMGDWESIGNHEYHAMRMVKAHPMPDKDDENYEFVKSIKEHFRKREREIKDERSIRQEKAILLKAKLVMLRQEGGINKLIEVSSSSATDEIAPREIAIEPATSSLTTAEQNRLELAEFYIKDLGVWDMYENFLKDRGVKIQKEESKIEAEEDTDNEWFHSDDKDE